MGKTELRKTLPSKYFAISMVPNNDVILKSVSCDYWIYISQIVKKRLVTFPKKVFVGEIVFAIISNILLRLFYLFKNAHIAIRYVFTNVIKHLILI